MSPRPTPLLPAEDLAAQAVEEKLRELAQRFDPSLRESVSRLLMAAAEAVLSLSDLDLVRHESGEETGGHHLALWEELAPVMGGTVTSVNQLIATANETFPPPPERPDALDNLDDAFGPERQEEPQEADIVEGDDIEIGKLASAVTSGMRRDVARLGERLRNPTIVSDPWNLISDLLEFRGRVRAGLGELIFQVCSFVAEVDRADVIPGYAAELEQSMLVRQATTNLAFLFRGHTKRIGASSDERVRAALQDSLKDLHAFSRTRALPALRTSDKRIFLETRAQLYRLVKDAPPRTREIKLAAENLARFLDSMSVVSRRENLRLQDRAQLARAGRHLEAATDNLDQPSIARAELREAVLAAGELYGRDAQLDAYLRAQRHFPVGWLHDPELAGELERFGALLAGIAAP
jgi:hypothetical protein